MAEKKTNDELLAETTDVWRAPSTRRDGRSPAVDARDDSQIGLRDLIARRAYELFEERGRIDGDDVNDWLRAEVEVRSSIGMANPETTEVAKRRRQPSSISGVGR
jgi:hypothetical protein